MIISNSVYQHILVIRSTLVAANAVTFLQQIVLVAEMSHLLCDVVTPLSYVLDA